jgi:hypothetical protein
MKQLTVAGRTYRGVLINHVDEKKYIILGESGQRYEFVSFEEATAFVDTYLAFTRVLEGRVQENLTWA